MCNFRNSIHRQSCFAGVLKRVLAVCLLCGNSCDVVAPSVQAEDTGQTEPHPYRVHVPAPPLTGGIDWLNTAEPLTLEKLRGKFVLLDFWTYCCINCIHVLPELKKLEHAYPNELVVIGVHSAKFDGERQTDNIRDAVMRYELEHPVVNDAKMLIWRRFGIRSWPSMMLIDPVGEAVWLGSGEQRFEDLKALLEQGLPYYRRLGKLNSEPLKFQLESDRLGDDPLRYPGKVLADATNNRLFISDSNHNQIVVTDLQGKQLSVIGSGDVGSKDGDYRNASFHHPQGMALVENMLYIADTENHLIRKVDLITQHVSTEAGTGRQSRPGNDSDKTALNSPWDLLFHDEMLYIAMAGPHQIWRMSLANGKIGPYAGNGREDIVDGPLLPTTPYQLGYSSFAQPSGLASNGTQLFVADSEGSSIRAVPFDPAGEATTLVGPVQSLFDFGDIDGQGREVRLQHPLGVAYHSGLIYVADTYNNKIKVIDPTEQSCRTLAGSGEPGQDDAEDPLKATFDEPAGLSAAAGKLYVADTNNHAIRVIDLDQENHVTTLPYERIPR